MLKKVQTLIADGNTDLSLTELLMYVDALETSCTGILFCINNYNPSVMAS